MLIPKPLVRDRQSELISVKYRPSRSVVHKVKSNEADRNTAWAIKAADKIRLEVDQCSRHQTLVVCIVLLKILQTTNIRCRVNTGDVGR